MAMLRAEREAAGRLWLLLRAIDRDGRGWLDIDDIRAQLATKGAPWRICGWRRLRQLLAEGEGIYWQRHERERLWLRGAHRVAYALDCERLQGYPVELPVAALLGGIQGVRAAFYGAFHSGRDAKPISRETLRELSGIAERTQRAYDRLARVERRANMAVGGRYTQECMEERAWQQGRAVFRFVDVLGKQGRKDAAYVAWHLPNSYRGAYERRARGSRKRLNRQLAGLLPKGITGNDGRAAGPACDKVFWADGAAAARQFNRDPARDAYWSQRQSTRAGDGLWHVLGMG